MSSILESRTNTVYYLKVYFILYHIEWDYVYPDVKRVQQKCFQIISTYRNSFLADLYITKPSLEKRIQGKKAS